MNDIEDILAAVEKVRGQRYGHLPSDLVVSILRAEAEWVNERTEASRQVTRLIEEHLDEEGLNSATPPPA